MNRWWQEVQLAATQPEGLLRTADLRALGLTREEQRESLRGLERLRRGTYLLQPTHDLAQVHLATLRAVQADRPNVAASHPSGALVHRLPVISSDLERIHVSNIGTAGRGGERYGVYTHYRPLPEDRVTAVEGIRVSDVVTTVVDCARVLPMPSGLSIADAALHQGLTTRAQLVAELERYCGTKGVATARRVVDLADSRTESPGESRTRLILVEAGFDVEPQVVITDETGAFVARADFAIEGTSVLIEFDGRAKFAMNGDVEAAHWAAKLRRDRLEELGFVVFVVVWRDLSQPREVIERLERVLRRTGVDPWALRLSG